MGSKSTWKIWDTDSWRMKAEMMGEDAVVGCKLHLDEKLPIAIPHYPVNQCFFARCSS